MVVRVLLVAVLVHAIRHALLIFKKGSRIMSALSDLQSQVAASVASSSAAVAQIQALAASQVAE